MTARPQAMMVFIFYLKAINLDIVVMITLTEGNILPDAYEVVVHAKNNLINARKLLPKPPMSIFAKNFDGH